MSQSINFKKSALETLRVEQQAIEVLATQIDGRFDRACEILLQCPGRVISAVKWQRHLHQRAHHHSLCIPVKLGTAT